MRNLLKSDFFKSISLLASGSIIAQLIGVIASPIMTRMYTPEVIGEYTLLLTAVGIFGSIICGRFDIAIVSEPEESNVLPLITLSFLLTIVFSIIVSLGFSIYYCVSGYSIVQVFFSTVSILVLLLLTGIANILISYNNRYKEYKLMTTVTIIRAIAKEIPMVVGGFLWSTSWSLVISNALGIIFGVRKQSERLQKETEKLKAFKCVRKDDVKKVAIDNKRQLFFSTPALLANNFSYSSVNIFIKELFGAGVLGLYSISYRLLGLPLDVISSNISRVYLEKASKDYNAEGNYTRCFLKTSLLLFGLMIPIMVALYLFAPWFCGWFFGEVYTEAGFYARLLIPLFAMRFIVSPLTVGSIISKKQNIDLYFQITFIIVSILVFIVIKLYSLPLRDYLLSFSIAFAAIYVVFYLYLLNISRR